MLPIASAGSLNSVQVADENAAGTTGLSVVIVDDDPNVLEPLCAYLQKSGLKVRGAQSADAALQLLGAAPADLVLSDVGMPGMDGVELCARLRAQFPTMPVILMTGRHSSTEHLDPAVCGAAAVLGKPFTMRQVLDLLARLLDRRPANGAGG